MGLSKYQLLLLVIGLIILVSGQEALSLRSGGVKRVRYIQVGGIGRGVAKGGVGKRFEKAAGWIGKAKEAADRAKAAERAKCYSDCKHATQRTAVPAAERIKYAHLCNTCRDKLNP